MPAVIAEVGVVVGGGRRVHVIDPDTSTARVRVRVRVSVSVVTDWILATSENHTYTL